MTTLTIFLRDEAGATAIEYGLIGGLIAVGILGGMTSAFTSLGAVFDAITAAVNAAL